MSLTTTKERCFFRDDASTVPRLLSDDNLSRPRIFFEPVAVPISLCSARESSMALRRALLSLRPSTAPSVARAFGTAPTGPVTVAERS